MGHAAGELSQGTHLFGLDQLILSETQVLVSRAQPGEELAVRYGRAQQVGHEIEELDLLIVEAARPGADALEDADGPFPGAEGDRQTAGGARPGELAAEPGVLFL